MNTKGAQAAALAAALAMCTRPESEIRTKEITLPSASAQTVLTTEAPNGWTAISVFVDGRGDASMNGATLNVYGRIGGVRALLKTTTGDYRTPTNPINVQEAVDQFEVEIAGIGATAGDVYVAAIAYGHEPASNPTSFVTMAGDVTGASNASTVVALTGSGVPAAVNVKAAQLNFASTVASPILQQSATAAATGQSLTIRAQNATTTGGSLILQSGTGATAAGSIIFALGASAYANLVPSALEAGVRFTLGTANVATTGLIGISREAKTILAMRNNAATADIAVLQRGNADDSITLGDQTNGTTITIAAGIGQLNLQVGAGIGQPTMVMYGVNGHLLACVHQFGITDSFAGDAFTVIPATTGATQLQFALGVTAGSLAFASSTTAAPGAALTLGGQNTTAAGSTGGDVILQVGSGATLYGTISVRGGMAIGVVPQAMADANQTISAVNAQNSIYVTSGALTANRTLTITRAPRNGNFVFVQNTCTGAFSVLVAFASGTSFAVPNGKNAVVWSDGVNAQGFTITP